MPAYRNRCVSLDPGKRNMGMFVGNMRTREIHRWRKIDLMSRAYAGRDPNSVRQRVEKFVSKMPRASVVLIEEQVAINRAARNLQKELCHFLSLDQEVRTVIVDPSRVRKWFQLRRGKRKKKVSAVDVASRILYDDSRLKLLSDQAISDVRTFTRDKKKDDYADSLLQWLYAVEVGIAVPPSKPSAVPYELSEQVIIIDD